MLRDVRPVITSQYINSTEWEIYEAFGVRNELKYECCENAYPDITFKIKMLRKPLYYVFNVIVPCLVLVSTILFGFFLPPESGERISLTITILLAVAVFLQLISDTLPRNSDSIPILGLFYMVVMAESALSLIITCVVLVVHHRSSEKGATPMPRWVRKHFLGTIARHLGIRNVSIKLRYQAEHASGISQIRESHVNGAFPAREIAVVRNGKSNGTVQELHRRKQTGASHIQADIDSVTLRNNNVESALGNILDEVKTITTSIKHHQKTENSQEEWRFLAKVLDRLFFWIFLLTCVGSALCILLPVYFKYH